MNSLRDSPVDLMLALAADLRRQAEVYERHARALQAELGAVAATPATRATLPMSKPMADYLPRLADYMPKKGKQPGAVTSKWKGVLLWIAGMKGFDPFVVGDAIEAAKNELGREMRPAEIKRQFEPYVAAGYLTDLGDGRYQFTEAGFEKIGSKPGDPFQKLFGSEAHDENEPPSGNAGGSDAAGWGASTPSPAPSNPNPWRTS